MISLLTLIRGSANSETFLRSVVALGDAVGAELAVAHPDPVASLTVMMGSFDGFVPPVDPEEMKLSNELAKRAFDTVCGGRTNSRFSATDAPALETLREHSLFADLCVLSHDQGLIGEDFRLLKESLVANRTPTVLLPLDAVARAPRTVVFSWNGQPASARAIRAAIPFARQAKRVVVLEHAGNEVNRSRLEHFLAARGVQAADWRPYGDTGLTARGRARALLGEAQAEACDLLVMGAYGDLGESFFRFGRATEKVASSAKVPVLFCH